MSIYSTIELQYTKTCNLTKACFVLLVHMGFKRNTVDCLKIATSLQAKPETVQKGPLVFVAPFFDIRSREYRFKFQRLCKNEL